MNYYELTYLGLSSLNEKELEEISQEILSFIKVDKLESPVKQRLAYLIKKEPEAFLISLTFYAEPESLLKLKNYLKQENKILRHLIIKTSPDQGVVKKRREKPEKKDINETKTQTPKSKVELSEIDKKIEEILQD